MSGRLRAEVPAQAMHAEVPPQAMHDGPMNVPVMKAWKVIFIIF